MPLPLRAGSHGHPAVIGEPFLGLRPRLVESMDYEANGRYRSIRLGAWQAARSRRFGAEPLLLMEEPHPGADARGPDDG